jgi:hypothetical protein
VPPAHLKLKNGKPALENSDEVRGEFGFAPANCESIINNNFKKGNFDDANNVQLKKTQCSFRAIEISKRESLPSKDVQNANFRSPCNGRSLELRPVIVILDRMNPAFHMAM